MTHVEQSACVAFCVCDVQLALRNSRLRRTKRQAKPKAKPQAIHPGSCAWKPLIKDPYQGVIGGVL